jgi:murein L,D-transpeptidase YcbB/YkuD
MMRSSGRVARILSFAVLLFVLQAAAAQEVSEGGQRQLYRKVSGDSLRLRNSAKSGKVKKDTGAAKSVAKPRQAKVDSLQFVSREYMLGERVIMRGDSGRDVRSVANILVKKLYMDEGDIVYTANGGVLYDGEIVKAVMRFQRLNGFHEDGIVGHDLIKALRKRSK